MNVSDRERILIKLIKIIIWLLPLIVIIWLFNKNFVPSGFIEIEYNINEDSSLVSNFAGKETDKLIGSINEASNDDYYQLITTTPVYFDVKIPRSFAKTTVTMKYQNPDQQPRIQLGVKQKNEAYFFSDMAFFNEKLENLDDHWNKIEEGDVILLQKNKNYYDAKQKKIIPLDEWYDQELEKLDKEYPEEIKSTLDDENYNIRKLEIDNIYDNDLNQIIDELKDLRSSELVYLSIGDFLDNFSDSEKTLKFNYNLGSILEMPGYKPSNKITEINKSIRGNHEIYTYIGNNEDLNYVFTIQDSNRHIGEDILNIKVYDSENKLIKDVSAPDDGEIYANGNILPERRHQLILEDLPFGTYKLVLDIPKDDIFIKKIETFQHLVMFKKNIYLTDNEEYGELIDKTNISPTTVYTNSNYVKARTSHENGLQILKVGDNNLKLEEKNILNEIKTYGGITTIISPKNDVYIEGDRFFSFQKDQLFDPNFSLVQEVDSVDNIDEFDYILAKYPKVTIDGEWMVSKTSIEAPNLYINEETDKVVNFMINLPGLPENDRNFKINKLTITFEKDPITFSNFIDRIQSKISNFIKN